MTPTTYAALAEAVEHGLYRGWDRVHEHTPQPRKKKLLDGLIRQCETEEQ